MNMKMGKFERVIIIILIVVMILCAIPDWAMWLGGINHG
jgi:cell division protein FtsL